MNFLKDIQYRNGQNILQSQVLDGTLHPTTTPESWLLAPDMIRAKFNITDDIYIVLPKGARPIFNPTNFDPGVSVSSRVLEAALTRHYGYKLVPGGGKGSHRKLVKPGSPPILLTGNRSTLSPGIVKHALHALGGHPISRLPDLLEGRLEAQVL